MRAHVPRAGRAVRTVQQGKSCILQKSIVPTDMKYASI